jgi:hypothetical protein
MNFNLCHSLLAIIFLSGCPDPSASSSGVEEDPTKSQENMSIGDNGPAKQESDPNSARFDCNVDECLELKGKFKYAGTAGGPIRVDVQKFREGAAPSLVHTDELKSLGEFSLSIPKNFGKIVITGFIDKDGNGPTSDDPQGRLSLEIKEEALQDLILEVKDDNPPESTDPTGQVPGTNSPPPPQTNQQSGTQPEQQGANNNAQLPPGENDKTAVKENPQPQENNTQNGPPSDE